MGIQLKYEKGTVAAYVTDGRNKAAYAEDLGCAVVLASNNGREDPSFEHENLINGVITASNLAISNAISLLGSVVGSK